jgi:hypothetical protein
LGKIGIEHNNTKPIKSVGETGGKDFGIAHRLLIQNDSCRNCRIGFAFELSGQNGGAASLRLYTAGSFTKNIQRH